MIGTSSHKIGKQNFWQIKLIIPKRHCQFHALFGHFKFIQFGEDDEARAKMHLELVEWLRAGGVPQHLLAHIQQQIADRDTRHSTREDPHRELLRRQLEADKGTRQKLLELFYFDYAMFGFNPGMLLL